MVQRTKRPPAAVNRFVRRTVERIRTNHEGITFRTGERPTEARLSELYALMERLGFPALLAVNDWLHKQAITAHPEYAGSLQINDTAFGDAAVKLIAARQRLVRNRERLRTPRDVDEMLQAARRRTAN